MNLHTIDRRSFLQCVGVALALPMLESRARGVQPQRPRRPPPPLLPPLLAEGQARSTSDLAQTTPTMGVNLQHWIGYRRFAFLTLSPLGWAHVENRPLRSPRRPLRERARYQPVSRVESVRGRNSHSTRGPGPRVADRFQLMTGDGYV